MFNVSKILEKKLINLFDYLLELLIASDLVFRQHPTLFLNPNYTFAYLDFKYHVLYFLPVRIKTNKHTNKQRTSQSNQVSSLERI